MLSCNLGKIVYMSRTENAARVAAATRGDSQCHSLHNGLGHQPKDTVVLWRWYEQGVERHSQVLLRYLWVPAGDAALLTKANTQWLLLKEVGSCPETHLMRHNLRGRSRGGPRGPGPPPDHQK